MELTFDLREIASKTKLVITKPKQFFKKYDNEKDIKPALVFSIVMSTLASLINVVLLAFFVGGIGRQLTGGALPVFDLVTPAKAIGFFFSSTILTVLLSFLWSKLMQFWLNFFKVGASFADVYKAYSYSRAPLTFLGWIPLIGILFSLIYTNYILILGITEYTGEKINKVATRVVAFVVVMFLLQATFSLFPFISSIN